MHFHTLCRGAGMPITHLSGDILAASLSMLQLRAPRDCTGLLTHGRLGLVSLKQCPRSGCEGHVYQLGDVSFCSRSR
eukprot:scaffold211035_cov19-Tisochrysis_lutea.AAC.1